MAGITKKSFNSPDEVRKPDKTEVAVVNLGGATAARVTFQPGWKWSECIKPVAGTDTCQAHHVGVIVSGKLHIVHNDGSEDDAEAGDVYVIEPGHDAWVVGDDTVVGYEFDSAAAKTFATK